MSTAENRLPAEIDDRSHDGHMVIVDIAWVPRKAVRGGYYPEHYRVTVRELIGQPWEQYPPAQLNRAGWFASTVLKGPRKEKRIISSYNGFDGTQAFAQFKIYYQDERPLQHD